MEAIFEKIFDRSKLRIYLLDFFALAAIYFVPTFSHMVSLPLYFIEPMRLALVLAIIYTNRTNAYVIALTLPAFSYFISSHPVLPKTVLISSELLLNVYLYYFLKEKFKNKTLIFAASIVGAKLYYYVVKYILLQFVLLQGSLVSTPILIQAIMVIVFTIGFYFLSNKTE